MWPEKMVNKMWCEKCASKISEKLDSKYGVNNWYYTNTADFVFLNEKNHNSAVTVTYPPLLTVRHRKRLRNGGFSKSREITNIVSQYFYCPFCGEKIRVWEDKPND